MENIIYIWLIICTLTAVVGFLCMVFKTTPINIFYSIGITLAIGAMVCWYYLDLVATTAKISFRHILKHSK